MAPKTTTRTLDSVAGQRIAVLVGRWPRLKSFPTDLPTTTDQVLKCFASTLFKPVPIRSRRRPYHSRYWH